MNCLSKKVKARRVHIFYFLLLLPFYSFLLGASPGSNLRLKQQFPRLEPSYNPKLNDLNQQLNNIRINNGTQGEQRNEADRLVFFGGQQQYQGNLTQAIDSWWKAVEIYHQIGDYEAMGQTYDFIGLAYAQLGRYQDAEDALRHRLAIARTNKDLQGQIFGLNNLGTILLKRRSFPAAKVMFEEALAIARSVKNYGGEGLSLGNLGLVAPGLGENDRAIALYEQALIARRRAKDPIGEAITLNSLGDAYAVTRQYRQSINAYGEALRISQTRGDRPNQFRAIDGLVTVYCKIPNFNRALELLEDRIALSKQDNNLHQELRSLQLLAGLYEAWGKLNDAVRTYKQAIHVATAVGDKQTAGILLYRLGDILPTALSDDFSH